MINRGIDEKYDISVIIPEALEQLYIKGDRELVMRLVENLLNNAINHNPQGCGITVSLAIRRLWIFKRIVLEISDTGRGVSREQLNYFRSSMKLEKLPEHGLGIRVVRQIALFHRWRLRFLNDEDGGFGCRIDLTPAVSFKRP